MIAVMGRVTLPHTRFTVDEFVRMVEADAFGTTRVELLNGRVFFMTQKEPHVIAVSKGSIVLQRLSGPDDWVRIQGTMRLSRFSAPDPDFLWLPCRIGTPQHLWPDPILLIEVSDTTYRKDSGSKLRKYAYHGMADYWIENLQRDRIEVHRDPRNPTGRERDCHYADVTHYGRGQSISVLGRPGVSVDVDELLP